MEKSGERLFLDNLAEDISWETGDVLLESISIFRRATHPNVPIQQMLTFLAICNNSSSTGSEIGRICKTPVGSHSRNILSLTKEGSSRKQKGFGLIWKKDIPTLTGETRSEIHLTEKGDLVYDALRKSLKDHFEELILNDWQVKK
jgi:DNA-binding MarR family transcriptional regulator